MTHKFDPRSFEGVAASCMNVNDEQNVRTAVGRYYYSWFLRIRNWLIQDGYTELTKKDRSIHFMVTEILIDNFDKLGSLLAASLITLKRIRNSADYETDRNIVGKSSKQYDKLVYNRTLIDINKRYTRFISQN